VQTDISIGAIGADLSVIVALIKEKRKRKQGLSGVGFLSKTQDLKSICA
jgi:hypothetical protein